MKDYLTQKQVLEITGLKVYQLERLIKIGIVPVINFGKTIEKKARSPPADIGNNCYTKNGNISMWIERKRFFPPE
ncbi:MAG: hypothetical protein KAX28_10685 [Candidatus Marinimicrobia bacterium]|nr:hypothetical protein [Candidatus Neomarinimicrobiota bacterium]